jgi:hypothetical protein
MQVAVPVRTRIFSCRLSDAEKQISKPDYNEFSWWPPTGIDVRKIIPVSQPSGNFNFHVRFVLAEF